jgi:hypothetical protein
VDPDEEIGPHAITFAQVMFAHSEFEREVCSLQGVITNDLSFGERRSNQTSLQSPHPALSRLPRGPFQATVAQPLARPPLVLRIGE